MKKSLMRFIGCLALLLMLPLLGGCGEYKEQIGVINAGVEALQGVQCGHLTMTTDVKTEEGLLDGYDSSYFYDYEYRIDVRTFNYKVSKTDLVTGKPLEPPFKVVDARKYDLATGEEDIEYQGEIGDFPDLLTFFFGAGLKDGYVGSVETLTDEAHPDWQGYRVHKSVKYIDRVNSTRERDGAEGEMLENYVDYWLDASGVLVRMDYFSRDQLTYIPAIENDRGEMVVDPSGEVVKDILNQTYIFELLEYNDPAIADF